MLRPINTECVYILEYTPKSSPAYSLIYYGFRLSVSWNYISLLHKVECNNSVWLMARVLVFQIINEENKVNSLFIFLYTVWVFGIEFFFSFWVCSFYKFTHGRCKGTHQQKLDVFRGNICFILISFVLFLNTKFSKYIKRRKVG